MARYFENSSVPQRGVRVDIVINDESRRKGRREAAHRSHKTEDIVEEQHLDTRRLSEHRRSYAPRLGKVHVRYDLHTPFGNKDPEAERSFCSYCLRWREVSHYVWYTGPQRWARWCDECQELKKAGQTGVKAADEDYNRPLWLLIRALAWHKEEFAALHAEIAETGDQTVRLHCAEGILSAVNQIEALEAAIVEKRALGEDEDGPSVDGGVGDFGNLGIVGLTEWECGSEESGGETE